MPGNNTVITQDDDMAASLQDRRHAGIPDALQTPMQCHEHEQAGTMQIPRPARQALQVGWMRDTPA